MGKEGLSLEHFDELNAGGVTSERLSEFRSLYADNLLGLEQLDAFDTSSEYSSDFREYRDAEVSGDEALSNTLLEKLRIKYPHLGKAGRRNLSEKKKNCE